ncbi:MAG: porin [Saprospiraceae bacterium]|nr:porin [Saprospiraceae bacterium]
MLRNLFIIICSSSYILCSAQIDSSSKLSFSGYGELYYSYDFSKPENHEKSSFLYNHKRHNEINANLILLKSNYSSINTRANLGIMFGNYAQYNLSSEPSWAKLIYEANIGVKLSKSKSLWLDAGIMPSHIGFESAISADCWTLTRSLLAENSPYYETGVKLSYTNKKEDLNIALLALNGWQKIQRPDGIKRPSFGLQLNLKPTSKFSLNYSNFLGSDSLDSSRFLEIFS